VNGFSIRCVPASSRPWCSGLVGVARHVEDPRLGSPLAQDRAQLRAAHSRHHDIGEGEVNRTVVVVRSVQGRGPAGASSTAYPCSSRISRASA